MKCLLNGSWAAVVVAMMVSVLAVAEPPLESNDVMDKAACKVEAKRFRIAGTMSGVDEKGNPVHYRMAKVPAQLKNGEVFKMTDAQKEVLFASIQKETMKPENLVDLKDLMNEGGTPACWGWGWGWPVWGWGVGCWGWRNWWFWW